MARLYTILRGPFRLDDGTTKGTGETIALEDDVAGAFADRIELVPGQVDESAAPASAPSPVDDGFGQLP